MHILRSSDRQSHQVSEIIPEAQVIDVVNIPHTVKSLPSRIGWYFAARTTSDTIRVRCQQASFRRRMIVDDKNLISVDRPRLIMGSHWQWVFKDQTSLCLEDKAILDIILPVRPLGCLIGSRASPDQVDMVSQESTRQRGSHEHQEEDSPNTGIGSNHNTPDVEVHCPSLHGSLHIW